MSERLIAQFENQEGNLLHEPKCTRQNEGLQLQANLFCKVFLLYINKQTNKQNYAVSSAVLL